MKWGMWPICLWLAACAGTETGNPSFEGTLGYDAYSSRPAEVAVRANASTRVDAAWLVLGDVTLDSACDANSDVAPHVAPQIPGLGAGDHAATQAPATPFAIGEGRYCALRIPFESAGAAEADARPELGGRSILLAGSLASGERFEIASAYQGVISLRAPERSFELDPQHAGLVIGFDLATWLDGLAWGETTPQAGTIRIDNANHASLLRAFEANLERGVALFRDVDDNGELDPNASPIATVDK